MAIRMKVRKAEGEYDLGASKFLGSPTLPKMMTSGYTNETIFFLQIRLEDIAEFDEENLLPHVGYLYVFLDTAGSEYGLEPVVRYTKNEPTHCLGQFNEEVEGYEQYIDDYLIEFEKCDDYADGTRLLGKVNSPDYENDTRTLLLQFDPLDSEMGIFSQMDGYIYLFFGEGKNPLKGVTLEADFS